MKWIFRRRYLVLNFQYYLLAANLVYLLWSFLIFLAIMLAPLGLELANSAGKPAERAANPMFWVHARAWLAMLVVFGLLLTHSILVSHRIAGPLSRFRRFFKTIAAGNLSESLSIRKRDYLQEDANVINEMGSSLRAKIIGIKQHYNEAWTALSQLAHAIDGGSAPEVSQKARVLEQQMESLKAQIDQFSTTGKVAAPGENAGEDNNAGASRISSATRSGENPWFGRELGTNQERLSCEKRQTSRGDRPKN